MNKSSTSLLTPNASSKSGIAVMECMTALNPVKTEYLKAEAIFIPDNQSCGRGSVFIEFRWPNFMDYPKVTFNTDIMRGFGIPCGSFDPNLDIFTFEKECMKLCVVSGEYRFALSGIRLI